MNIFMVGIGGIGMSALAQLYIARGHKVLGSDRTISPTTELLESKGVHVFIGHAAQTVPHDIDLLVYSDAIQPENPERAFAAALQKRQISYFKALGEISEGARTIAVSGTHGKTTTSAMLTKILIDAGKNPTAVIGSLIKDFEGNFVNGDPNLFVVEACEYRDHILELSPNILVINNVEWDHTDWFTSEDAFIKTFHKAALKVPVDGVVVTNLSDKNAVRAVEGIAASVVDYSKEVSPKLKLIGEFNQQNARAAITAARVAFPDITLEAAQKSVASFQGSWRRFEKLGKTESGAEVYDDYAHHPTAVRSTIEAARAKFKDKKIVVAFHPHLYTRTRDLMEDFARAFDGANSVVVAPIYAAREEPIEGVTSEVLVQKINEGKPGLARALESLDAVYAALNVELEAGDVLITMGAGDIYKVARQLVV